jgi:steroid 5-alpha reductase family enzyme
MMLGLQTMWMLRLSYNTWRRGLFNINDEDYRWQVLRNKIPRWFFQVTNLTFIAIGQNIILFLLGLPAEVAARQPHVPLGPSDFILGGLSLLVLLIEFIADNQQNSFQNYKHTGRHDPKAWPGSRIQWTEDDAKRGFVARGLWGWSRHPNFLCEQSFWILQNFIPIFAPQPPSIKLDRGQITPLWLLTPALVLCALFFNSTLFTESITRSKYPIPYAAYQRRVAMFVPILTPVWGLWLKLTGEKNKVDELVWGKIKQD